MNTFRVALGFNSINLSSGDPDAILNKVLNFDLDLVIDNNVLMHSDDEVPPKDRANITKDQYAQFMNSYNTLLEELNLLKASNGDLVSHV